MRLTISIFCLLLAGLLHAQEVNLIPNPGFEEGLECTGDPPGYLVITTDVPGWYDAGGTPDIVRYNCFEETNADPFYYHPQIPPEGHNYAHFIGALSRQGGFYNESVGVRLNAPLEAGRAYDFATKIFVVSTPVTDRGYCVEPRHQFNLYASVDSFKITNIPLSSFMASSEANGRVVFRDDSDEMFPVPLDNIDQIVPWFEIGGCFTAKEGEQYLGISHNVGWVDEFIPPCEPDYTLTGALYLFAINIDDVRLYAYPESLEARDTVCLRDPQEIDLTSLVPEERFEEAEFIWPDGVSQTVRYPYATGLQEITVKLPCVDIPLYLDLVEADCSNDIYLPNAFSPNFDGVNDIYRVEAKLNQELLSFRLQIFNRWGNLVFSTSDINTGWDGKFKGQSAPSDVYTVVVEYELARENDSVSYLKRSDLVLMP